MAPQRIVAAARGQRVQRVRANAVVARAGERVIARHVANEHVVPRADHAAGDVGALQHAQVVHSQVVHKLVVERRRLGDLQVVQARIPWQRAPSAVLRALGWGDAGKQVAHVDALEGLFMGSTKIEPSACSHASQVEGQGV